MLLCTVPTGTRTIEVDNGYEVHQLKEGPRLSRTVVFDDHAGTGKHMAQKRGPCGGDACCGSWAACMATDGDPVDLQWEDVREDQISYAPASSFVSGPCQATGAPPLGLCCVCICIGLLLLVAILFKLGIGTQGAGVAGTLSHAIGFRGPSSSSSHDSTLTAGAGSFNGSVSRFFSNCTDSAASDCNPAHAVTTSTVAPDTRRLHSRLII
mmetsp:Transcript_128406/g.256481  ORF Transcript_128406/g.256481 Transcript_128406/m.256481 type:complete len:210 (-) Transcript_128406:87-716(-)